MEFSPCQCQNPDPHAYNASVLLNLLTSQRLINFIVLLYFVLWRPGHKELGVRGYHAMRYQGTTHCLRWNPGLLHMAYAPAF